MLLYYPFQLWIGIKRLLVMGEHLDFLHPRYFYHTEIDVFGCSPQIHHWYLLQFEIHTVLDCLVLWSNDWADWLCLVLTWGNGQAPRLPQETKCYYNVITKNYYVYYLIVSHLQPSCSTSSGTRLGAECLTAGLCCLEKILREEWKRFHWRWWRQRTAWLCRQKIREKKWQFV